jgi:hypothetical protein
MALGFTQPLTGVCVCREFSLGVKRTLCLGLTTKSAPSVRRLSRQCGILKGGTATISKWTAMLISKQLSRGTVCAPSVGADCPVSNIRADYRQQCELVLPVVAVK